MSTSANNQLILSFLLSQSWLFWTHAFRLFTFIHLQSTLQWKYSKETCQCSERCIFECRIRCKTPHFLHANLDPHLFFFFFFTFLSFCGLCTLKTHMHQAVVWLNVTSPLNVTNSSQLYLISPSLTVLL